MSTQPKEEKVDMVIVGERVLAPPGFSVSCTGCDAHLEVDITGFVLNIVGIMQFQCINCGTIMNTPGLLEDK